MLNHRIRDLSFYYSFIFDIHPTGLSERSVRISPLLRSVRPSPIFAFVTPMRYSEIMPNVFCVIFQWTMHPYVFKHICRKLSTPYPWVALNTFQFRLVPVLTMLTMLSARRRQTTSSHASIHNFLKHGLLIFPFFYQALGKLIRQLHVYSLNCDNARTFIHPKYCDKTHYEVIAKKISSSFFVLPQMIPF